MRVNTHSVYFHLVRDVSMTSRDSYRKKNHEIMSSYSASDWLSLVRSKKRLDRDKGLTQLKQLLVSCDLENGEKTQVETGILSILENNDMWEEVHGAIMAAGVAIQTRQASQLFCDRIKEEIPKLLDHNESRIRLASGEVLGVLCVVCGCDVYSDLQATLLRGIKENLERAEKSTSEENSQLVQKLGSLDSTAQLERSSSPNSAQIFHDTAGWKTLETYMLALQHAVVGCGPTFETFLTSDLLQLIFTSLAHTNRFVRETGYKTLAAIVKCPNLSPSTTSTHWSALAQHLANGLADNWSQVRMSASVATREFLAHLTAEIGETSEGESPPNEPSLSHYLPILLPAMCLNRYYVAEGVRLYSQETWHRVTGQRGVEMVEKNIANVVDYYISQSQASNHAVREAACTCIAELGTKVSNDCLRPFISRLIEVLLECFKDDSWPVRDAACLACGNFVSCFPEECRSSLDVLFPLFFANLEDSIPSVRQGAAVALANVVKAYGSDVDERVFTAIGERLPLVAAQSASEDQHTGLDARPAVFGVVKRVEWSQDSAHTDQQMYSCGSLAPKMRRGGCMDSSFHKPAQLWEKSEGCVHLLSELSWLPAYTDRICSLLPTLSDAAKHKQYPQHFNFLETLMKQLPVVAKALGKRTFKRYLELFLDPIFYTLSCDNRLVQTAGEQCLVLLTQLIGHMIMRGRVEQCNPKYVSVFDRTLKTLS